MKDYREPRAVLWVPLKEDEENLRRAFRAVGIEAYPAFDLETCPKMALRTDTLAVVLDARTSVRGKVLKALAEIQDHPQSDDVLTAVIAEGDEDEGVFVNAGANHVLRSPVTLASSLKLVWRLSRRRRITEGQPPQAQAEAQEPSEIVRKQIAKRQASHKIYIGAAPGVGKTYSMLSQAHELLGRGEDVVAGIVETHGRKETELLLVGLPVLPKKEIDYKGTKQYEMDLDAILDRHPSIVLVDELAHSNIPGSLNAKRYEDAQLIRMAGISVVSTLNVQHLESLNNVVERITGVKVRETVPDMVLEDASELILADISPQALQQRLQEGKIYGYEKISQSLNNFFTTHNLTALRELVLRELADRVEISLEAVRADIGKAEEPTGIQDRILVCMTASTQAQRLIRRGARLADRLSAKLIAIFVENGPLKPEAASAMEQNIELAESLEAEVVKLPSPDVAGAIARFANENQITIIMLGESHRPRLNALVRKPIMDLLLHQTTNIDIVTVASNE